MKFSASSVAVLALSLTFAPLAAAESNKPNFVIIFTDDQGYQDLGCYGSPDIDTPNLDRMAAEGTRFTSFYAQTICGPSRTALMTASYPLRVAQDKNRCEIHPVVHSDEITLAEVLKPRGYKSAAFGKWDLATHSQANWIDELLPRGQGFDYFYGTPTSNDQVVHLLRNEEVIERKADMATVTRRYTDEALQFIEKNKDAPFFVYLAHTMPHTRLAASEDFKGKSKGGLYGDVIEEIDHNAGRILDKIKELGLDDNTYVIFTSDNGPWLIRKDHGGHALPLRSGKTTCWEGGLRVPCIVRAPGRVPAGATNDLVTATIDLMPTIATLAGAEMPDDRTLDGLDISKVWHGKQSELDRPYFYYQHFYLRAVRSGDWKVMLKHEEGPKSATSNWKNHVAPKDSKPLTAHQLYNLKEDIGETTNLADKHPEKLAELLELAQWARTDIGDFDRIGTNARFFDDEPDRIENPAPIQKPKRKGKAKAKPPKPE
ncbi:sulfatase [Haloferula sp.]|uniref:sulfatase family protein n=1 Tax=Haloferula sp. TaxID=2497595 RepID=UPI00329C9D23